MKGRPVACAPSVGVRTWEGHAVVTIACGDLEATFLPEFMLGTSLRFRGEEFLALPGGLEGYRQRRVTGLPLLAPWANRLSARRYTAAGVDVDLEGLHLSTDENGLPIHGTMTAHEGWEILALRAENGRATLRAGFDYGAHPDLLEAFPFPHRIEIDATVDALGLSISTTVRPTGESSVPISFGYHPYFRLPGAPTSSWRLLLPERDHLELDGRGFPTGKRTPQEAAETPIADRTYDDLFALGSDRRLGIERGGHRLTVEFGDTYPFAQVYRPEDSDFVCLEPMTAPTNALVSGAASMVAPRDHFTAAFTVTVEGETDPPG